MFRPGRESAAEPSVHGVGDRSAGRDQATHRGVMKSTMIAIALLFCSVASAEWHNALKPTGPAGGPLTIVENGEAKYSIVLPAEPTTQEKKAADDLRHWVREMTGADLKISAKLTAPTISISTRRDFSGEQYEIAV